MKILTFEINGNMCAISLDEVVHFFSKKDINSGFLHFNNKIYYVYNVFNCEEKIIVLFNSGVAIYFPKANMFMCDNIKPYNKNYDICFIKQKIILLYKSTFFLEEVRCGKEKEKNRIN